MSESDEKTRPDQSASGFDRLLNKHEQRWSDDAESQSKQALSDQVQEPPEEKKAEVAKLEDSSAPGQERAETNTETDSSIPSESTDETDDLPGIKVYGQSYQELPKDLYIPPDALEVVLDAFQGPLDLLLYLIRKQNLNILDVPIADVTHQYMAYVELMKAFKLELAAEYLVMAALLGEIKSRMLLPRPKADEDEEGDPRLELIRRLQEYERFKKAAEDMDELPRLGRDLVAVNAHMPERPKSVLVPEVSMQALLFALKDVLQRADLFDSHQIERETLSTRERMSMVLQNLQGGHFVPFGNLFEIKEGRLGVIVTFLAVLELVKESLIELVQHEAFAPIHVRLQCAADQDDEKTSAFDELS